MREQTMQAPRGKPGSPAALLLRLPTVMAMTGLGRSTIYRLVAEDKFPAPVRLSARAIAWRLVDLQQWSDSRDLVTH